jgi:hypothetical protein
MHRPPRDHPIRNPVRSPDPMIGMNTASQQVLDDIDDLIRGQSGVLAFGESRCSVRKGWAGSRWRGGTTANAGMPCCAARLMCSMASTLLSLTYWPAA